MKIIIICTILFVKLDATLHRRGLLLVFHSFPSLSLPPHHRPLLLLYFLRHPPPLLYSFLPNPPKLFTSVSGYTVKLKLFSDKIILGNLLIAFLFFSIFISLLLPFVIFFIPLYDLLMSNFFSTSSFTHVFISFFSHLLAPFPSYFPRIFLLLFFPFSADKLSGFLFPLPVSLHYS